MPEAQRRDGVGPDVSKEVYACVEEAGPMFGHLYGFGSFLASPRGDTVASELEVLSSVVAHAVGEMSKGSESGVGGRMGEIRPLSNSRLLLQTTFCPMKGFT